MKTSEALNRITIAKRSQAPLVAYLANEDPKIASRVRFCGSWIHIREWLNSGETRMINANFCKKHLLCQACAVRRGGRLLSRYGERAEWNMKLYPQLKPAVMTLTVVNGMDLNERLAHLNASLLRMSEAARKGKSISGRHAPIEWNKVAGSVRAIEVTKGKDGSWHPHAHAFVLLDEYIDQAQLSREWLRFTGDSFVVGITECKNGIVPGLLETLKYATKFSEMSTEDTVHAWRVMSKQRLVSPHGVFRGVLEGDINEDEIEPELTGPFRDMIASWIEATMGYSIGRAWTFEEAFEIASRSQPQPEIDLMALEPYPPMKLPF
jgi:hypothetical protein